MFKRDMIERDMIESGELKRSMSFKNQQYFTLSKFITAFFVYTLLVYNCQSFKKYNDRHFSSLVGETDRQKCSDLLLHLNHFCKTN